MARSQNAFIKREKEKKKARKKQEKQDKKELRKQNGSDGSDIDWSSAPENKTLTKEEKLQRAENQKQSNK